MQFTENYYTFVTLSDRNVVAGRQNLAACFRLLSEGKSLRVFRNFLFAALHAKRDINYVKKDIMKKVIATCFFFILCLPLYAQWSVGGKIGVNWSKVHFGNTLEDPSFKTGVNAGAVASFQLSQWFDVQAELTYSGQGYRMKDLIHMDEESMDLKDLNVRYHYLSLPLLVKFYPFVKGFNM